MGGRHWLDGGQNIYRMERDCVFVGWFHLVVCLFLVYAFDSSSLLHEYVCLWIDFVFI